MGRNVLLDGLVLWNRRSGFRNQVGDFELFAADNAGFTNAVSLGNFSATGLGEKDIAVEAQVFSFSSTSASHIRMRITAPLLQNGSILSAGEIAFRSATTSTVPGASQVAYA